MISACDCSLDHLNICVFFKRLLIIIEKILQEPELLKLDNSAQIFNALSDVPGDVQDVDQFIEVIFRLMFADHLLIRRVFSQIY